MKNKNYSVFIECIDCLHQDVRKLKRLLNDNRMTQVEKKIIKAWLEIRNSNFEQAKLLLDQASYIDCEIINAHYQLVKAIMFNNCGQFDYAKKLYKKILVPLSKKAKFRRSYMLALENKFILELNLKNTTEIAQIIKHYKKSGIETNLEKINYLRMIFNLKVLENNYEAAKKTLNDLETLKKFMSELQIASHIIDRFDFHFKLDQYHACMNDLNDLKKHKKFYLSSNYKFMQALLNFIVDHKPLYLYPQYFMDFPILYYQVNTLLSLEASDLTQAKNYWSTLKKLSPKIYLDDFTYQGEKCLFSEALTKIQASLVSSLNSIMSHENSLNQKLTTEELTYQLLSRHKKVTKEQLIKLLWGNDCDYKEGMKKLSVIISRIRKKYQVEIKTVKDSYLIPSKVA
jgi:hypothetical protein